ncbi:MAG: NnrU family protein [Qingshengfaniella sp.]
MIWLLFGLALWWVGHFWRRLLPGAYGAAGGAARAISAGVIGVGVILMILGFRGAAPIPVWEPPHGLRHLNNLLVLVGFYLFAVSGAKTRLHRYIRHPQLIGFALWAVAHLLVNGDLASVVLFGGLLVWAVAEIVLLNRLQPAWTPPSAGPVRKEITSVLATLVLFGIVGWIHGWLGYNPFG